MLAVLDPWLLQVDEARGLPALPIESLEDLVWMLSRRQAVIPAAGFYWNPFMLEILRPLVQRVSRDHRYKSLLDRLRDRAQPVTLAPPIGSAALTGFDAMFDPLGSSWGEIMRQIVARCAQTDETIVVTRLVPGRNARVHDHDGRPALVEKLCWELHVRSGGHLRRIPCVCNSRNLELRWTCRYADGLPAHEDGAAFPFCPPPDPMWAEPSTQAWRGSDSRPAWRDRLNHFWGEPAAQQATGRSYHWDVYLNKPTEIEEYGRDQLNIGRWRPGAASDGQPAAGAIHHDPKDKRPLKKLTGWTC